MSLSANIATDAVCLGVGAGCCLIVWWWRSRALSGQAESAREKARLEAETAAREARLAAQQESLKVREENEKTLAARRAEQADAERRLAERESLLNTQLARVLESEQQLRADKDALTRRVAEVEEERRKLAELAAQRRDQLQAASHLSAAQAREELLKEVEQESLHDASNLSRRILDEAKARAEEKARQVISVAIQRYAGDHTFESTTATVALSGDEIKGRIIGREGRNIRAFEAATGVTILVDDTPGAVVISAFDPVRREIARQAMERLVQDGRIHPTRIEEVVAKVKEETDETIVRLGEEAVAKTGLPPMNPEIVKVLGRLHFRHSYSQNILDHSVEVAHLMGLMASELGVDVALAKRAGLLHDIGKAVNHEVEGPHAIVGADLIKRHGECPLVVNGVASHHNDVPPEGPLGVLVSAADAISASRPGARSESMSTYLKRIEDLEKAANSFPGVEKSYAVQAGRELRVFVLPDQVNDEQAFDLARKIAAKVEAELQYPGQIKVSVIRETRCVEVAR